MMMTQLPLDCEIGLRETLSDRPLPHFIIARQQQPMLVAVCRCHISSSCDSLELRKQHSHLTQKREKKTFPQFDCIVMFAVRCGVGGFLSLEKEILFVAK